MFTGDKAAGMVGSIAEVFPGARYQRCTVHFYRNALAKVPKSKRSQVAAMLKTIHAMESREAASAKAGSVAAKVESMRLKEAAKVVREGFAGTLTYCEMPPRALAAHTHEQRHRAAEQGDPPPNPRRRHVPRRETRAAARGLAPLSPWEASHNRPSPGPSQRGQESPWYGSASRECASRTPRRRPGARGAGR